MIDITNKTDAVSVVLMCPIYI